VRKFRKQLKAMEEIATGRRVHLPDAIPLSLLDAPLHGKGLVRVGCGGIGNHAHLSGAAYASPFPDKAPLPE
jgi:hypothetical protein